MVTEGQAEVVDARRQLAKQEAEEKRLAELMIPKKHRRLYKKIQYKRKKTSQEVSKWRWLCVLHVEVVLVCCFMDLNFPRFSFLLALLWKWNLFYIPSFHTQISSPLMKMGFVLISFIQNSNLCSLCFLVLHLFAERRAE